MARRVRVPFGNRIFFGASVPDAAFAGLTTHRANLRHACGVKKLHGAVTP